WRARAPPQGESGRRGLGAASFRGEWVAGVELTDGLGVAQRQLGKFGIGADILKDLPRAGAFCAFGPGKDHGDAGYILQAEGSFGTSATHELGAAGDGNFSEIDAGE